MNIQSIILLAVVLAAALWVLRFHLRNRQSSGCHGSCNGCHGCPSGQARCPGADFAPAKERRLAQAQERENQDGNTEPQKKQNGKKGL